MAAKKMRWVCPNDCGNNSLAPSRFRKDGLSQGCFEFGATCAKKIANREGG